jgi:hypothetical protein
VSTFFIHKLIVAFADDIDAKYETLDRKALFLSSKAAQRCHNFIKAKAEPSFAEDVKLIDLFLDKSKETSKIIVKGEPPVKLRITPILLFLTQLYMEKSKPLSKSSDAIFRTEEPIKQRFQQP